MESLLLLVPLVLRLGIQELLMMRFGVSSGEYSTYGS